MHKLLIRITLAVVLILAIYSAAAWYVSTTVDNEVRQQLKSINLIFPQTGLSEGIDLQPGIFRSTLHTRLLVQTATPAILELNIDHLPLSGLLKGDIARISGSIHPPTQETTGSGNTLHGELSWSGQITLHYHNTLPGNKILHADSMDIFVTGERDKATIRILIPHLWQQNPQSGLTKVTGLEYEDHASQNSRQKTSEEHGVLHIQSFQFRPVQTISLNTRLSDVTVRHQASAAASGLSQLNSQIEVANIQMGKLSAGPIRFDMQASHLDTAAMQTMSTWLRHQHQISVNSPTFNWNDPVWQNALSLWLTAQPRIDNLRASLVMPIGDLQLQSNLAFAPIEKPDLLSPTQLLKKLIAHGTLTIPAPPSSSHPTLPSAWTLLSSPASKTSAVNVFHFDLDAGTLRVNDKTIMVDGALVKPPTPTPATMQAGPSPVVPATTSPSGQPAVHRAVLRCIDSAGHVSYTNTNCPAGDQQIILQSPLIRPTGGVPIPPAQTASSTVSQPAKMAAIHCQLQHYQQWLSSNPNASSQERLNALVTFRNQCQPQP